MNKIKSTILLLFYHLSIFGQFALNDPSFEGNLTTDTLSRELWIKCEGSVDLWRGDGYRNSPDPLDGEQFIGMVCGIDNYSETISQYLPDTLKKGQNYFIDNYVSYWYLPEEGVTDTGHVSIYIGNGACDLSQKIASIKAPDTLWTNIRVRFTPDDDYTSITYKQEEIEGVEGINYIFIDKLSQIFIDEIDDVCKDENSSIKINSILSKKSFNVQIDEFTQCNYQINLYSINGQLIWKDIPLSEHSHLFSLANYPSGIYFVIIENKNGEKRSFLVSNN